jgi:hypothetical protein
MKYVKTLLAASALAIASNAVAADKTIFIERYVSNPPAQRMFVTNDYAGFSKDKPCSDLVLRSTYEMMGYFSDHSFKDDSSVFVYRAGPRATCYKRTMTMAGTGNVYSTGDIQLTWDTASQSFVAAMPATATVDVSKG